MQWRTIELKLEQKIQANWNGGKSYENWVPISVETLESVCETSHVTLKYIPHIRNAEKIS